MTTYIQVIFPDLSATEKELLVAHLSVLDINGIEETEKNLVAYFEAQAFQPALIKQIADELNIPFETSPVQNENWNALWERNFQPVLINDFCCIRADFHPKPEKVLYDIIITPKMAFGTGHHATTELMITLMQQLDLKDKHVFDFGTGTGILAILAEKLGARFIFAVDNDEWAITNAKENFEGNAVQKISLARETLPIAFDQKFDLILANINRNVLLESMKHFTSMLHAEGCLLLSGILLEDVETIASAAAKEGFALLQENSKNGWYALLFQLR